MSNASTIILLPFIIAFISFVLRFYSRDGAASIFRASFLLALLTILTAATYLTLGVLATLPEYGTVSFGMVGMILMVVSVWRWFLI